jgi:hypothetical protein
MMRNNSIIIIFYKIDLIDEVAELPVLTDAHLKLTQLAHRAAWLTRQI